VKRKKRRGEEEKQKLCPSGELFNRQGRKKENFKRYSLKYILKAHTIHGARISVASGRWPVAG